MLALSACTPEQVMVALAQRGDPHAQTTYHQYVHRIPVPASDWQRYVELSRALTAWSNSEAGRNQRAIQHAHSNGARGTCTETGIMLAESGGDFRARNGSSTASGAWQYLRSTWAGYGGYVDAADAPPWLQHERFHQTWANGAGRGHWAASVCG